MSLGFKRLKVTNLQGLLHTGISKC